LDTFFQDSWQAFVVADLDHPGVEMSTPEDFVPVLCRSSSHLASPHPMSTFDLVPRGGKSDTYRSWTPESLAVSSKPVLKAHVVDPGA